MSAQDELLQAQPVIDGKLYFVALRKGPDSLRSSALAASAICFSIDDVLLYEPFFADFGPLNLGRTARFCRQIHDFLQEAERCNKRLYYFCGPHAHHKANAAVLIGIYQVIYLNRSAEDACKPLQAFKPYVPFRDASCGVSTFHLTVFDVVKGIQKARDVAFIDWNSGCSTWSLEEYEHYEQVENGDLNWIVPGKLVAFSGPANRGNEIAGYRLHTPEDYWDYYRKKGVTAVVRLNKKAYDRQRFTAGGFRHYDLYFPDGSCPSEAILFKFLEIAESEPGALAIHCKAGLGRTGVLICCYIMKHFRFTAEEVIGYIRVCRPGSVIGPQQNFLRDVEARMWHEGDMWRAARGINKPHLALEDLSIHGRAAMPNVELSSPNAALLMSPTAVANGYGRYNNASPYSTNPYSTAKATTGPMTPTRQANGMMAVGMGHQSGSQARSRGDAAMGYISGPIDASGPRTPPYTQQNGGNSGLGFGSFLGLSVQVPSPAVSQGGSQQSSTSSTPTGAAAAAAAQRGGTAGAAGGSRYMGRSITPMRYTSGVGTTMLTSSAGGGLIAGYAARMQTGAAGYSVGSTPGTTPGGAAAGGVGGVRGSTAGRAPSVDRSSYRTASGVAARSAELERASSASSDISMLVGRMGAAPGNLLSLSAAGPVSTGPSAPIPTTPKPTAPGHRPNAGVARTLAPNGQPRKIPIAMLPEYHAGLHRIGPGAAGGKPLASAGSMQGGGGILSPNQPDMGRIKTAATLRYGLHSK